MNAIIEMCRLFFAICGLYWLCVSLLFLSVAAKEVIFVELTSGRILTSQLSAAQEQERDFGRGDYEE